MNILLGNLVKFSVENYMVNHIIIYAFRFKIYSEDTMVIDWFSVCALCNNAFIISLVSDILGHHKMFV